MDSIGTYQGGFRELEGMVNPAWLDDEMELNGGLDGRDGVVVERVTLGGLELVAIEFPEAA
ncbi:MAG: hypothetical protein A2150_06870 [Candidatus Muproteobacteria bacterium RBG_16_64_11]|uniref:Uncharacterized protein n=1 Tax=Candidatus Muproteobacteria bacterium RBG_16_64_11 TaxID=1817758 RepID=A0A1F6THH1_9PROT|nr:MAG: hypothetical protein A2150_06870 [Candidatus Muproteobacteria bacterium RBG_16_64_11]